MTKPLDDPDAHSMPDFLFSGPAAAETTLLLAHGAGAPMDSSWMNAFADALAEKSIRTARFEFSYMAARRSGDGRKPPPRAETVKPEFIAALQALAASTPLIIGGKSMGGRVASMIAEELFRAKKIAGLVCLGYPFHPPGQPQKLRTAHLETLTVPTLICQGTRDPFGAREEVSTYRLSPAIEVHWLEDGDHDFRPRKESGRTARQNMAEAVERLAVWIAGPQHNGRHPGAEGIRDLLIEKTSSAADSRFTLYEAANLSFRTS